MRVLIGDDEHLTRALLRARHGWYRGASSPAGASGVFSFATGGHGSGTCPIPRRPAPGRLVEPWASASAGSWQWQQRVVGEADGRDGEREMALVSVVTDGAQGPGLSGAGIAGGAAIVFVGFVVIVIIFLSGFASY